MTYMLQKLNLCVTILHKILLYLQCNFLNALFKSHKSNKQSHRVKVFDINLTTQNVQTLSTGLESEVVCQKTTPLITSFVSLSALFSSPLHHVICWLEIKAQQDFLNGLSKHKILICLSYVISQTQSCFTVSQPQLLLTWVCAEMWSFHNYYKQPQNYHHGRHIY